MSEDVAPKGYMYAEVTIKEEEPFFREYIDEVFPMMKRWGGKFLVLGGEPAVVEGDRAGYVKRVVIIEFESRARLEEFYYSDEYVALTKVREKYSSAELYLLTGVTEQPY